MTGSGLRQWYSTIQRKKPMSTDSGRWMLPTIWRSIRTRRKVASAMPVIWWSRWCSIWRQKGLEPAIWAACSRRRRCAAANAVWWWSHSATRRASSTVKARWQSASRSMNSVFSRKKPESRWRRFSVRRVSHRPRWTHSRGASSSIPTESMCSP